MKFKQIDGQNQRNERISPTQLVVGIDMAKETHVAQATNFRGIVLAKRHLKHVPKVAYNDSDREFG